MIPLREAARRHGVSQSYLLRLVRRGEIRAERDTTQYRRRHGYPWAVNEDDVRAWVARLKRRTPGKPENGAQADARA